MVHKHTVYDPDDRDWCVLSVVKLPEELEERRLT